MVELFGLAVEVGDRECNELLMAVVEAPMSRAGGEGDDVALFDAVQFLVLVLKALALLLTVDILGLFAPFFCPLSSPVSCSPSCPLSFLGHLYSSPFSPLSSSSLPPSP